MAETHVDDSTANSPEQLSEDHQYGGHPQGQHEGQQHWHDHGHEHEHGHGHEQHENQHHQEHDGQPGSHEQEDVGVFYETFLHYVEFSKFFVSVTFIEISTLCFHCNLSFTASRMDSQIVSRKFC